MVERVNHKLLDRIWGMWLEVGTSRFIWTKKINIIAFLINCSPIKANPQVTFFQILYKIIPMFDHVRVFGNQMFIFITKDKQDKLQPKAKIGQLLKYDKEIKR